MRTCKSTCTTRKLEREDTPAAGRGGGAATPRRNSIEEFSVISHFEITTCKLPVTWSIELARSAHEIGRESSRKLFVNEAFCAKCRKPSRPKKPTKEEHTQEKYT